MTTDKTNEIITTCVTDVHALVAHGAQAIHRQVEQLKNVSHQDAKTAVVAFETLLKKQEKELEARIKALGGSTTQPVKDAVSAVGKVFDARNAPEVTAQGSGAASDASVPASVPLGGPSVVTGPSVPPPPSPSGVGRRAPCHRRLVADACNEASEPNRDRGQHDEEAGLAIHGHKLLRGLV